MSLNSDNKNSDESNKEECYELLSQPPVHELDSVRNYLKNVRDCIEQNHDIDWKSVLQFCKKVLQSQLPTIRGAFISVAYTIDDGLSKCSIDFELKDEVWELIKLLIHLGNTDRTPIEAYSNYDWDFFTIARNTLSGCAFQSVYFYTFWCKKHTDGKLVDEVKELILDYLGHTIPTSIYRDVVLSQHYPALYELDKEWFRSEFS